MKEYQKEKRENAKQGRPKTQMQKIAYVTERRWLDS